MLRLVVGNLNYSSWSMRAWLALKQSGLEFKTYNVDLFVEEGWKDRILSFSGAGKVPVLVDGALTVHESLAICEYVAEKAPGAGLWPSDATLRARGRAISCEMVSGFFEVRNQMPTNLRARAKSPPAGEALEAEVRRLFDIWGASLATSTGDFLLGDFTIADCMFMPVISRFRTYGVELPEAIAAYSARVFALPLVQELEGIAADSSHIAQFDALLG